MGDVALLVPVLRSLVASYPAMEVTVATRPRFAPLFEAIERVHVFEADVDLEYNGLFGLYKLLRALRQRASYEMIVDVHDNLRTKFIRSFFRLRGTPVTVFNKGRREKRAFTRRRNKIVAPLPHTVERYKGAFENAKLPFQMLSSPHLEVTPSAVGAATAWLQKAGLGKKEKWIGVAPFAMHQSKVWPLDNYRSLLSTLSLSMHVRVFLFGGGKAEIQSLERLRQEFPAVCTVVAGQMALAAEIALIKQLDLMVCTDSANMHLAALAGTPVLSIWGGTHPDVGFGPYQAGKESIIQIDREQLPCRPCSVYGREDCYVGGFPCLHQITPAVVAQRIVERIH